MPGDGLCAGGGGMGTWPAHESNPRKRSRQPAYAFTNTSCKDLWADISSYPASDVRRWSLAPRLVEELFEANEDRLAYCDGRLVC